VVGGVAGCCGAGCAEADTAASWTTAARAAIEAKRVFLSMFSFLLRTEQPVRRKIQTKGINLAIAGSTTLLLV
jgi:hypothetical protein